MIRQTPAHLLHEIILVDDASELPHLKDPLEKFAARVGKVRIIRSPLRTGLIRARLIGASIAKVVRYTPLNETAEFVYKHKIIIDDNPPQ